MTRCPVCCRVPHRHDCCRVCRAVRADLEVLRRTLSALRSNADAAVLEAAERYERETAVLDAYPSDDAPTRAYYAHHDARLALLVPVRARRGGA